MTFFTKALLSLFFACTLLFATNINDTLSNFTLSNDEGGLVSGGSFDLSTLKKPIYLMFYVDPDEKDLNDHVSKAIKALKFPKEIMGSIACINLAATWKPNFIISSILSSKQKEFPNTIYIKDTDKKVLNAWNLKDDSSNVILFDKNRKVLFIKKGELSQSELRILIKTIKKYIYGK